MRRKSEVSRTRLIAPERRRNTSTELDGLETTRIRQKISTVWHEQHDFCWASGKLLCSLRHLSLVEDLGSYARKAGYPKVLGHSEKTFSGGKATAKGHAK